MTGSSLSARSFVVASKIPWSTIWASTASRLLVAGIMCSGTVLGKIWRLMKRSDLLLCFHLRKDSGT